MGRYFEVGPVVFVIGLAIERHHDPLEDLMGIGLPLLDVQLQEGLDVDPAGDIHSLLAVGEMELLLLGDALPELRFVVGGLVPRLVLVDDLLVD
jgi:hypothetical protein